MNSKDVNPSQIQDLSTSDIKSYKAKLSTWIIIYIQSRRRVRSTSMPIYLLFNAAGLMKLRGTLKWE